MAGRFLITASRDLGGLGVSEGPPVLYKWTTAGRGSEVLPWLAILGLLALKPNRGWAAWWVWLPLMLLVVGNHWLLQTLQNSSPNGSETAWEIFLAVPVAWGFGLAALWLLASNIGGRSRLLTVLGNLGVLTVFSVCSFAAEVGGSPLAESVGRLLDPWYCSATAGMGLDAQPLLLSLILPAPVIAAALALCGLACRGGSRPIRLSLWLILSLLAGWIAVSALLHGWCHVVVPNSGRYALFLGIGLFMGGVSSVVLLPFLILSAVSPFHRERLKLLMSA